MTSTYFAWDLTHRADAPCVRDDVVALDYAGFARRVEGVAEQLGRAGVRPGDVVATFLPNRIELLVTLMAAWRIGAVATPVNPAFTPEEAEYQLADSGARVVIGTRAAELGSDRARFDEMVATAQMLEHAEVFGNLYGSPRAPVEAAMRDGRDTLFDVDWQGGQQIRASALGPHVVSIFILPPSMAELERRLRSRGQDSEEVIQRRQGNEVSGFGWQ